jgi:hypothetical protein
MNFKINVTLGFNFINYYLNLLDLALILRRKH